MARRRNIVESSDEEEFPDIAAVTLKSAKKTTSAASENLLKSQPSPRKKSTTDDGKTPTVRRRRLGQITGNALLRPASQDDDAQERIITLETLEQDEPVEGPRVVLKERKARPVQEVKEISSDEDEDAEDDYVDGDSMRDFIVSDSDFVEEESASDDDDDLFIRRSPSKPRLVRGDLLKRAPATATLFDDEDEPRRKDKKAAGAKSRGPDKAPSRSASGSKSRIPSSREGSVLRGELRHSRESNRTPSDPDLSGALSRLKIDEFALPKEPLKKKGAERSRPETPPPSTPPKPRTTELRSPQKIPRIPMTPHGPALDEFWRQELVDDWNDEHSPKKMLFPDATKSPAKAGRGSSPQKSAVKTATQREARRAFERAKHDMADRFLRELDESITDGKLAELAAATGGIRIVWSNKLNTTAGRAHWRRETVRTTARAQGRDGGALGAAAAREVSVQHRHHASIELAEKVIDDEERLLNVIAHEFCHLANFMVSGVTGNPHGREFKAWAAKCSRRFGQSRGIEVTTRHSYEIDFKYVWECASCGLEYKRHSKSVDTARHRCGRCKGELKQTRPAPRGGGGAGADGKGQPPPPPPSAYQRFMKEQMKVVRKERPGIAQRDVMKIVAERWSQQQSEVKAAANAAAKELDEEVDVHAVAADLVGLTLEAKCDE